MAQATQTPAFFDLLVHAVSEPGLIGTAYYSLNGHSIGEPVSPVRAMRSRGVSGRPGLPRGLGPGGSEHFRGHIQHRNARRGVEAITERSAQRIFEATRSFVAAATTTCRIGCLIQGQGNRCA